VADRDRTLRHELTPSAAGRAVSHGGYRDEMFARCGCHCHAMLDSTWLQWVTTFHCHLVVACNTLVNCYI